MSQISDTINAYFIEMITKPETKQAMIDRLKQNVSDRPIEYPSTDNHADAFYVVLGCRFQDNPLRSILLTTLFFVAMGLMIGSFISGMIG